MNLLKETIDFVQSYKYIWPDDVDFIQAYDYNKRQNIEIPISLFTKVANYNYDAGYGAVEVDPTLEVVMKNGDYFIRREYDGSESWLYIPVNHSRPEKIAEEYNPFLEKDYEEEEEE